MKPSRLSLLALLTLGAAAANAQSASPVPFKADVVVSAEAAPAEASSLGVAVTVIGQEEIERSKASGVLELLRTVAGVDIVQSGGPGAVTSAFIRGANSNQLLLLVDGVKWNSPYFGSVDLSSLPVANIEKIEVVRGPFSALYGSDAVGGVIQVFTKRGPSSPGYEVNGSLSGGNAATREGTLSAGYSTPALSISGAYRRMRTDGDLDNDDYSVTNSSATIEAQAGERMRIGATFRREKSESGIPFSGPAVTPNRKTTVDMTTVSLPVTVTLGKSATLEGALLYGLDKPTYRDPDDPWGYTWSDTRSERTGGRAVLTSRSQWNRFSIGADYERSVVRNEDSYGLALDDQRVSNWSVFIEDRAEFFSGRLTVTAGLRRDDHSTFGDSWNPRATISYRLSETLRLRAAGGTAFRAPTTGELYYPFSGNPALQAERSESVEGGFEWRLGAGATLETTAFFNDVEDLIQYDFASQKNMNVGHARMQGLEVLLRGSFSQTFSGRVSYTYLDAEDRDTGLPLLRRPKTRVTGVIGASLGKGSSLEVTGMYVGERDDVDAVTFARVTSPSYVRFDAGITGPVLFNAFSPFARVNNIFDRQYSEVAGYPSPGRRYLVGLELRLR